MALRTSIHISLTRPDLQRPPLLQEDPGSPWPGNHISAMIWSIQKKEKVSFGGKLALLSSIWIHQNVFYFSPNDGSSIYFLFILTYLNLHLQGPQEMEVWFNKCARTAFLGCDVIFALLIVMYICEASASTTIPAPAGDIIFCYFFAILVCGNK